MKKIVFGNDHSAVQLKKELIPYIEEKGYEVINVGTDEEKAVDYPVIGEMVANMVASGNADLGIAVCGTGLGVVFPEGSLAPAGVKLIPTQLISSFGDFVLFYILYKIYCNEKTRSMTAGLYLVLYAVGRFIIEYFRGDEARGFLFGLSTSQFISIFMMIAGLIVIYVSRNREKKAG